MKQVYKAIFVALLILTQGCGNKADQVEQNATPKPIMFVVSQDDGYVQIPAGASANAVENWIQEIMNQADSPDKPPALSPWVPEFMIWKHEGSVQDTPILEYVVVANGKEVYLGDKHNPRKHLNPRALHELKTIMKQSGRSLEKYDSPWRK